MTKLKISDLQIFTFLGISTVHITKEDDKLLGQHISCAGKYADGPLLVFQTAFGYFVGVGGDIELEEDEPILKEIGYSDAFIALLQLADDIGCNFVRLDGSGDIYEGLPQFKW